MASAKDLRDASARLNDQIQEVSRLVQAGKVEEAVNILTTLNQTAPAMSTIALFEIGAQLAELNAHLSHLCAYGIKRDGGM